MSRDKQLRGITCPDMTKIIRAALEQGWEWHGFTGGTHAQIRWPKSGAIVRFGTTPSVASWKSVSTEIERLSGVTTWRRGNRKRSRKNFAAVDPQVEGARKKYAAEHAERLEAAYSERERARMTEAQRRADAQRTAQSERRRREIEELMRP